MKRKSQPIGRLVKALAAALLLLSCTPAVQVSQQVPSEAEKPVVRVGETVLTEADLEEAILKVVPSSRGMEVEEDVLNAAMKEYRQRYGGASGFREKLRASGTTEKEFLAKLERRFLITKYVNIEITKKAVVSDEEVAELFEKHKREFKRPRSVWMLHILVRVDPAATREERLERRKRAEEVLEKLGEGGDFAQLAWDYSNDPYRVKGGDFGIIHEGQLDPDLEKAVFALEAGETSGIIETIYGFHIVRVKEVREPEQLPLEAVAGPIKQREEERRTKSIKSEILGRLRASTEIEVYE
jgi:parvulin-like peptidyl-prolyl isomerase